MSFFDSVAGFVKGAAKAIDGAAKNPVLGQILDVVPYGSFVKTGLNMADAAIQSPVGKALLGTIGDGKAATKPPAHVQKAMAARAVARPVATATPSKGGGGAIALLALPFLL